MAIAPNTMRLGRAYRLTNYGVTTEFQVLEVLENDDFVIKDINLLETLKFQDLIRYGKGDDYDLEEISK